MFITALYAAIASVEASPSGNLYSGDFVTVVLIAGVAIGLVAGALLMFAHLRVREKEVKKEVKKEDTRKWRLLHVYTPEQTLELARLWDAYMTAPRFGDHEALTRFWMRAYELSAAELPKGMTRVNRGPDFTHWTLEIEEQPGEERP